MGESADKQRSDMEDSRENADKGVIWETAHKKKKKVKD